jgi:alanine-synthesizing transaminase
VFSHRWDWRLESNPLVRAAEARRAAGLEVIDLAEANPTRAGFLHEESAVLEALASRGSLRYDPDPRGLPAAREAVAAFLSARGAPADPASVLLTVGTSEAYSFLFKLLADPGAEVVVTRPSYALLEILSSLESLRRVPVPLERGDWRAAPGAFRGAVGPRTAAVVVENPKHPVGRFWRREELAALDGLCAERGAALIVDEVFADYRARPVDAPAAVTGRESLTFSLGGLSKASALPQMKLGWIRASGPPALVRDALDRLEFIADAYLSVGTPVQHAAARFLELGEGMRARIRARVEENARTLADALGRCAGVRLLDREGGWYGVVDLGVAAREEDLALRLLREDGVLVHPGYFYEFPTDGWIVVCLIAPPDLFREGVRRLAARIESSP